MKNSLSLSLIALSWMTGCDAGDGVTQIILADPAGAPAADRELYTLWNKRTFEGEGEATCFRDVFALDRIASASGGVAEVHEIATPPAEVRGGWELSPLGVFPLFFALDFLEGDESDATVFDQLSVELADVSFGMVLLADALPSEVPATFHSLEELPWTSELESVDVANISLMHVPNRLEEDSVTATLFGQPIEPGFYALGLTDAAESDADADGAEACLADATNPGERVQCVAAEFQQWLELIPMGGTIEVVVAPASLEDGNSGLPGCE